MSAAHYRRASAEIDLDALAHNAQLLRSLVAPAALCAVVKADGYGHGAVTVARAALAAGASHLAVALVEEGTALRAAGIDAPVLLLTEPPADAFPTLVAASLTPTIYTASGLAAAVATARAAGRVLPVQVKVDTGMHRVGIDPRDLVAFATVVAEAPELALEALWTHLAVADEPDDPFTASQLERLREVRAALAATGHTPPLVHAANSAGAIAHPASRLDLVRVGIALYGYAPAPALRELVGATDDGGLRPVLTLRAEVHLVRELPKGARPSYGRRRPLSADAAVATVPLGYADGVPRRLLECGGEVLIGGRRRPLAGTVTMDQIVVEVPVGEVHPGDEVVLIGRQGDEEITAAEWAARLGTIPYEILCGIGPRVPRHPVRGGKIHRDTEEAAVYDRPVHEHGGPAKGALR